MKERTQFSLWILFLVAPVGMALGAGDTSTPTPKGRVLLLQNERTLEGDIERAGDQYCVRRSVGETWVPAAKVLKLCQDDVEAYTYLRDRANLRDPDERLRLAKWCYLHDLHEQAMAEVAAAAQLRPEHTPTMNLLASLKHSTTKQTASTPSGAAEAQEPTTFNPVEVTQESLGQFVTRVQPILLNACASCHASGRGGSFKLVRPPDGELTGRKTQQQNLTSVLAQVNLDQPQASPLLTRAVSIHGEMKDAPLRGRQLVAYRTLEDWVKTTSAINPHLRSQLGRTEVAPNPPRATEFGA